MIEVLKNKTMIGVGVVLLAILFINAGISNKLEENHNETVNKVIVMNIQ